jgi:hypothetical protein
MTIKFSLLGLAVALAAMIIGTACSGDSGTKPAVGSSNASQASVDTLSTSLQLTDMKYAAITIAGLPLHEMDTAAQSGKIDGKYIPTARTLVRVLALTDWTPGLKDDAAKFHDDAVTLLKALDGGTIDAVKAASQAVHEQWHMFPGAVWAVVAKDLPADAGGPEKQSGVTPTTSATPHP